MNRLVALVLFTVLAGEALAAGNGVCGGRPLPSGKTREWRNHILVCSQNASHFLREAVWLPEEDRKEWSRLNRLARVSDSVENRKKMQLIGRKLPDIKWTGQILYETVEHWDWTDWVYGADPSCGYDEHEDCTTDSQGRKHCHTVRTMRSCWHDEDQHESRHCSNEVMPYESEFLRPNLSHWGPSGVSDSKGKYYDELPNKYDLLPGESEDIQIYNTGGGVEGFFYSGNQTMVPYVVIGDAWNKYEVNVHPNKMACVFGGGGYRLKVAISTEHRIKKRSPNPFRAPVNRFGKEIEAVQWDLNNGVRVSPYEVKLSDASAVMIQSIARNSRAFGKAGEIAEAEAEASRRVQDTSAEKVKENNTRLFDSKSDDDGFDKDTNLRLRLIKILPRLQRDVRTTANLYGRGAEMGKGATADHYEIELSEFWHASGPFNDKWWHGITARVEPGYKYEFRVSMYQKGVPFYYQEEDFTIGGEDNWFSKELPIPFEVPANATDLRSGTQKLAEYYQKPWYQKGPISAARAWWSFLFE